MSNTPGGIKTFLFADFDKSAPMEEFDFSKEAPEWRTALRGLNLGGVCKNKKCKAFNKHVVSPLGFGEFDLAFQIYNTPCPICKKDIDKVQTAYLYMTKLKVEGERVETPNTESSSISDNNDDSTVNSENLAEMEKVIATTDTEVSPNIQF